MSDTTQVKIQAQVDASSIDAAATRWERAARAIGGAFGAVGGGGQNPNAEWNPRTGQYHDRDTGQFVSQPQSNWRRAAQYGSNFASSAAKQMGFVGVGGMAAGDIYGARQSIAQGSQIEALSKSFGNTADQLNKFKEQLLTVTRAYGVNYQELTKFTDALKAGGGSGLTQAQASRNAASIFSLQNSGLYSMQAGYGLQTSLLQGGGGANMNVINAQVAASLRTSGSSMAGRGDELVSSVQSLVDTLQQQGGATGNIDQQFGQFASMLGTMGASGVPGLMGAKGANLLSTMGQSDQSGIGFAQMLSGMAQRGAAPRSYADMLQARQNSGSPQGLMDAINGMNLPANASDEQIRQAMAISQQNLPVATDVSLYKAIKQSGNDPAQQKMVQAIMGITDTSKQGNALDLMTGQGDQSSQLKTMLKQTGMSDNQINKLVNGPMTGSQAANVYAQNINNSTTASGDVGKYQDAQRSVEGVITGFVQAGDNLVSSIQKVAETVQGIQGLQSGPLKWANQSGALPALAQVGMFGGALYGGLKLGGKVLSGLGNLFGGGGGAVAGGGGALPEFDSVTGAATGATDAAASVAGGAGADAAAGGLMAGFGGTAIAGGAGLVLGGLDIASNLKNGNKGGAATDAGFMAGGAAIGGMLGAPLFGIGAVPGAMIGGGIGAGVGWIANNTSLFDGIGGLFGGGKKKAPTSGAAGKQAAPDNTPLGSTAAYGVSNMQAQSLSVQSLSLAGMDLSSYYHSAIAVSWPDSQMTVLAQRIAQYEKAAGVGGGSNGGGSNGAGGSFNTPGAATGQAQKDIIAWANANAKKLGADPAKLAQMELGLNYYEIGGSDKNPFQFSNDLAAQYGTNGSVGSQLDILAGMGRVGDAYQAYVAAGGGAAGLQKAENIQEIPDLNVEAQRGGLGGFNSSVSFANTAYTANSTPAAASPAATPAAASAAASTNSTVTWPLDEVIVMAAESGMTLEQFQALTPDEKRAIHDKLLKKYPKLDTGYDSAGANTAAAGQATTANGAATPAASTSPSPDYTGKQAHDAWLAAHPGDYSGANAAGTNAAAAAGPAPKGWSAPPGASLLQRSQGNSGSALNVVVNGKVTVDLGSLGSYDLPVQGAGQANDASQVQPVASNY